MPYVSAKYQKPGPLPMPEGSPRQIEAIDDQGNAWALTEDSLVGDWTRYLAEGGTIDDPDGVLKSEEENGT